MKSIQSIFIVSIVSFFISCDSKKDDKETSKVAKQPIEIGDAKFIDEGKKSLNYFVKGDITNWIGSFADNAIYSWSNGDSIKGKSEIEKYWRDRREKIIEKYSYKNDEWLSFKVNQSENGITGDRLLFWFQATIKYKNGKPVTFWVHNDYHFDSNGKIDRAIQYVDRVPIINSQLKK